MLKLAMKLAKRSTHHQHHHAVIITKGSNIVAVGSNRGGRHAEIDALMKIYPYNLSLVLADMQYIGEEWRGNRYTLYSFRFRKDGTWGMAFPCQDCHVALMKLGVRKIFYTNEEGKMVRL